MDKKFTQKIKDFLDSPQKDWADGVEILFRLRANPVEYRKLIRDPESYAQYITAQLRKFYDFRSSGVSHEQVVRKVEQAERAADEAQSDEKRSGKRPDHEQLPPEIRQLYDDNLPIYRRIADYHAKIRLIIQSKADCKDADLLPFATEIVRLDKIRLQNWKKYDSYRIGQSS